jgi:hypothetical protein
VLRPVCGAQKSNEGVAFKQTFLFYQFATYFGLDMPSSGSS